MSDTYPRQVAAIRRLPIDYRPYPTAASSAFPRSSYWNR